MAGSHRAIPLTGEDQMIAMVDGAIGGKTTTHTKAATRHSRHNRPPVEGSHRHLCPNLSGTERGSAVGLDT